METTGCAYYATAENTDALLRKEERDRVRRHCTWKQEIRILFEGNRTQR